MKSVKNVEWEPYKYLVRDIYGEYDHSLEQEFGRIEQYFPTFSARVMKNIEEANLMDKPGGFTKQDRQSIVAYIVLHLVRNQHLSEFVGNAIKTYGRLQLDDHNAEVITIWKILKSLWSPAQGILLNRCPIIEYSPRARVGVFTCDTPVLLQSPTGTNGIIHNSTVILFPLNRRSFIRFSGTNEIPFLVKPHELDRINQFNRMVIGNAVEGVYGPNPCQLRDTLRDMGYQARIRLPTEKRP